MSFPRRFYYWGCDHNTPYKTVEIADMRSHHYGAELYFEVPHDEDGNTPTHWAGRATLDNPSDTFKSENTPLYYGTEIDVVSYGVLDPAGLPITSWSAINGMSMVNAMGLVPPGVKYIRLVNAGANDPGVDVPGKVSIWFFTLAG